MTHTPWFLYYSNMFRFTSYIRYHYHSSTNGHLRTPISAILYPHEIFIIWRPKFIYMYLAPPLIIWRPKFKLSRAPTYYLAPPLIISCPDLLSRARLIISRPDLLSRAPTYYLAPEIKFIWRPHVL